MRDEQTSDLSSAVVQTADGAVIRVHVQPKARHEQILGMHGGRIKLAVTEPPDKGKANAAVVRLVAVALELSPSCVELLRGDTSRQKDLLVRNLEAAEVSRLLAASLP
jgi:uncharacterized protein (TIGR00251 family)